MISTRVNFEDPFGKTEYEVTVDEAIIRNIATIIETVENAEDTYVIITSREEVFKEFEGKKIGKKDLRKYQEKLSVKTPSYDPERRKALVEKYAKVMNCKWFEDEDLKNTVLETIKDKRKLPTPLNIAQFAKATAAKKPIDKDKLVEIIEAKSIETVRSFAEEIKVMSKDKILFLSFPFISEYFSVDFVKENYQILMKELEGKQDGRNFDRIRDWFKDDKIDVSYDENEKNEVIRFSHPSYSEAFRFVILDGFTTIAGETLLSALLKLADNKDAAYGVAHQVASNYDVLPDNVQNTLPKLADREYNAYYVADAIADNCSKLPENVQNLLIKLARNKETDQEVAHIIREKFDKLPEKLRNELLVKLSDKNETAWYVSETIAGNFYKLNEEFATTLLLKLSNDKETHRGLAFAILSNYDKLPENIQNIIFKMADNKEKVADVASAICSNYNRLPECVQKLLLRMAENDDTVGETARGITHDFDKMPEGIRNELCLKLVDEKTAARDVSAMISNIFGRLPENVRNESLLKLADNEETAFHIAMTIAINFDKLPGSIQNILFKLANKRDLARDMARVAAETLARHLRDMPENVQDIMQNILIKLGNDEKTVVYVANAITDNFDLLPENERNLLFKLADNIDFIEVVQVYHLLYFWTKLTLS